MKKTFETPVDTTEEIEQVRDPRLVKLWKKYGFMGQPPFKDSPAEQRLLDLCEQYSNLVLSRETTRPTYKKVENPTTPEEKYRAGMASDESDSYFKSLSQKNPIKDFEVYDSKQRELHNQIALMVTGKQRSDIEEKIGEMIADFAFVFAKGHSRDEAFDKISA